MQKVIAKIRLNPGHGGFFDPITRIHLTHGEPEADVLAGMNTTALKAAVKNRRISLISGSLGEYTPPFKLIRNANGKIAIVANQPKEEQPAQKLSPKKEVKPKAEPVKETTPDLPTATVPAEEPKPVETVVEPPKEVIPDPVIIEEPKIVEEPAADISSVAEEDIVDDENPFEDISSDQPEGSSKKKKKKK